MDGVQGELTKMLRILDRHGRRRRFFVVNSCFCRGKALTFWGIYAVIMLI
jgi:hypothetical protein